MNFKVSQLKQLGPTEVSAEDFVYIIDINPTDGGVRSKKVAVGDLVDYRITNSALSGFVLLSGSYADPSFVASLDWAKILNTPTTIDGYGITDAYTKDEVDDLIDTVTGNEVVSMSITGAETKSLNLHQADGDTVSVSYTDTYTFTQPVPSASWSVTHNMNKFPSVTIVDSAGNIVEGETVYNTLNTCTLNFQGSFSGKAYFN
jgi:hypothetical protein